MHIRRTQPRLLNGDDIADGAVVHALHRFDVAGMVTALQARDEAQPLLLRELDGSLQPLDADRIDGVRLLDKDVLAGLDGGLGIEGMEFGGVRDDHHVGDRDHMLVGFEAGEAMVVGNFHLVRILQLQRGPLLLNPVEQDVAHRYDVHVFTGIHGIHRGGFSASSTADDADLDDVAARDVGRGGNGCERDGRCRELDEVAPGWGVRSGMRLRHEDNPQWTLSHLGLRYKLPENGCLIELPDD